MRLKKLEIKNYKNLKDFVLAFNDNYLTTVFLGKNGAAKSNLIEALVMIFKTLDLGESPPFAYKVSYECKEQEIEVIADPAKPKPIRITVNGSEIPTKRLVEDSDRKLLPKNVFGYYSGTSRRLETLFERHQEIFYRQQLDSIEMPLRSLFYAKTIHSQYVLLAFFSSPFDNSSEFLKKYLGITSFVNVEFVLKEPPWYNEAKSKDDYFWGAKGLVRVFLDDLRSLVYGPIKRRERLSLPLGKSKTIERIYMRIDDIASMQKLSSHYKAPVDFFKTLESTYISDVIDELKIRFMKQGVDSVMEFTDLSEGEQQLLTVLGLLKFTKQEESIFLLDEPDTHLNPKWKYEYIDILKEVVGESKTSQIIIITHDPLLIAGLKKEQVRIFIVNGPDKRALAYQPEFDPIGLGFTGLLTSDMFGLDTTVDKETQQKLDLKKTLTVKANPSQEDKLRLAKLDEELEKLGFNVAYRDPLFSTFLRAIQQYDIFNKKDLSPKERQYLDRLAFEIIKKIKDDTL